MVIVLKKRTPRKKLRAALKASKAKHVEGFDAKRFNGALPMKGNPVKEQRKQRDEWA
ncbi:MAG: hypothetical protein WAT74_01440 [Flavobacteriales bacterium]